MNTESFKKWLCEEAVYSNPKLVQDCISRASRVERAFQAVNNCFSFENEFRKDKGDEFLKLISRRGVTIKEPVALPIGTNQMDSIVSATKKYFKFLYATRESSANE